MKSRISFQLLTEDGQLILTAGLQDRKAEVTKKVDDAAETVKLARMEKLLEMGVPEKVTSNWPDEWDNRLDIVTLQMVHKRSLEVQSKTATEKLGVIDSAVPEGVPAFTPDRTRTRLHAGEFGAQVDNLPRQSNNLLLTGDRAWDGDFIHQTRCSDCGLEGMVLRGNRDAK